MRALVMLLLFAIGCAPAAETESSCGHVKTERPIIVVERGDTSSAIAKLADGCFTETPADPVIGNDQNLLGANDRVFLGLNDQGTLAELDVDGLKLRSTVDVYPDLGPPRAGVYSIYGVAIDDANNLWVSRADAGSIAILRPDGSLDGTVDLSDLDPDDGIPEMNGILIEGGRAYVAVGILEPSSDTARRNGAIVVIDTVTRARVSVIELHGKNPVRAFVPAGEHEILVATPGDHDSIDPSDGIDRVDLAEARATQLVSEEELGGSVDEVVWGGPNEIYAIVLGDVPGINPTRLVKIDLSKQGDERVRTLAEAPYLDDPNAAAYVHVGLALTPEAVLVGDQAASKIRAFSRATGDELAPIPTRVHPPAAMWALP